jgi:ribosomal protein S18 acetylase RimI-like enzyme
LTFKIRPFGRDDTDPVLELANAHAAFDGTTSEADLAVTGYFPAGFWVAEDKGKVVGFVYAYFKDVPEQVLERWKASKVGSIGLMAVAPDHRRLGVGNALLSMVLEELKKAGADLVLLDCPAEATEAKRLYEKMGFDFKSHAMKKRL